MSNSEALDVFMRMYDCKHMDACSMPCKKCKYNVKQVEFDEALNNAIEALELCVMVEDDGR